jgi:cytoskeletal protein CcmA (bactofilin family)
MFGRKRPDDSDSVETDPPAAENTPASASAAPAGGHPLRQNLRPEVPRPADAIPAAPTSPASPAAATAMPSSTSKEPASVSTPDPKTLIVGRDISLSGDITACDKLIVEGSIEANMQDCRVVEIAESGLFKGKADIGEADISGSFEGTLTVHGRLVIRATGSVRGEVAYGELEIETGGRIQGTIKAPPAAAASATAAPAPAAAPTAAPASAAKA